MRLKPYMRWWDSCGGVSDNFPAEFFRLVIGALMMECMKQPSFCITMCQILPVLLLHLCISKSFKELWMGLGRQTGRWHE